MYINVLTQIGAKAVDQNYIYSVPKELISKIKVGIRVKISFGKMILEGFVTKINPDINYDKTKIKDILDNAIEQNKELENSNKTDKLVAVLNVIPSGFAPLLLKLGSSNPPPFIAINASLSFAICVKYCPLVPSFFV